MSQRGEQKIDLMIRQWKQAKQIPATTWLRGMTHATLLLLLTLAAGAAQAATPLQTRTALAVATRQAPTQAGSITETVLAAHVTDSSGKAVSAAAGAVSFDTETTSLGSAVVDASGDATLVLTSLPAGANSAMLNVHAVYHPAVSSEGTALTAASTSSPAIVQSATADVAAPPDFTVTANPTSLSVTQGQYATTVITVTPTNGFNEQVTLSCSNLPEQVTCTFSPVIASTGNGAFTSTLEVQTQAPSSSLVPPVFGPGSHVAFGWLVPGVLLLAGLGSVRRKAGVLRGASAVLLVFGGLVLGGCSSRYGYNHHPPLVAPGTPTGTYTGITVAASGNDGSAVTEHDLTLTLQVK